MSDDRVERARRIRESIAAHLEQQREIAEINDPAKRAEMMRIVVAMTLAYNTDDDAQTLDLAIDEFATEIMDSPRLFELAAITVIWTLAGEAGKSVGMSAEQVLQMLSTSVKEAKPESE